MVSSKANTELKTDTNDVQSYLISRYREALKAGDKSYAKSCLLSTRLFSVNDPSITYEIYLMAKSDNDIGEAAKCFTSLVNHLLPEDESVKESLSDDNLTVLNHLKEEIRLLMSELKVHSLKLKSTQLSQSTTTSGQQTRLAPSVAQSPLLSPRRRMASEDRATFRESIHRLDSHLHSTTKSFFYQQLFDNLAESVKRHLCDYSIETCDNPFERCRLMMLTIVLINEIVNKVAPNLLKTLMELSKTGSSKQDQDESTRHSAVSHYAANMLVLDAIPLIFSLNESDGLNAPVSELISLTLRYYSEHCLESASSEYEFEELHDGLKKTIATRILGKELNICPDDPIEETLITSLNLLTDKYLLDLPTDETVKKKFRKIRSAIKERGNKFAENSTADIFESEFQFLKDSDILDGEKKSQKSDEQEGKPVAQATPYKGRGRPKKVQSSVIVTSDDVSADCSNKYEREFIIFSLAQMLFQLSMQYLKQIKSKILVEFDNPLSRTIEAGLIKSQTQRSSRSKNSSQETSAVPPKKIKTEHNNLSESASRNRVSSRIPKNSPLNSEQSKRLDNEIMKLIDKASKCDFYLRKVSGSTEFKTLLISDPPVWLRRIRADVSIRMGTFDLSSNDLACLSADKPQIKKESNDSETSTLTVTTGPSAINTQQLRAISQMISCQIQQSDKQGAFQSIDNLLSKIRLSGLLMHDGGYSAGNIIEDYMILLDSSLSGVPRDLGFLFFDTLSLIRYVVDILMDVLRIYVNRSTTTSDTIIGHTIVLSQFDWPKEAPLYERCITWIRTNKPKSVTPQCLSASTKFTYPQFFQYVTNLHIIEDFMSLFNEGYTLDIASNEHAAAYASQSSASRSSQSGAGSGPSVLATSERASTRAGKSMTTRGVNRNFKDQLKCMLVDQMEHSSTLVPLDLITGFIQSSLLPFLNEEESKKR